MSEARILIVEDDPGMQRLLSSQLSARGYEVRVAGDGPEALRVMAEGPIHLVLLDITLPGGMDGLEICRRVRALSSVPIIMLTVTDAPETKVNALELGGDDYLTKPFHSGELIARIRAALRRAAPDAGPAVVQAGDLTVDLARREVRRGEDLVRLTKTEFDLLHALVTRADRVLTYKDLLVAVWGPGYEDLHAIHVHMSNLRRKLEGEPGSPRCLLAVPGVGYRFHLPDETP
jgi:two-component system KDP operon response regulator KdpE